MSDLLQGPHPDIFRVSNDAAWMNSVEASCIWNTQKKCGSFIL